MHEDQAWAIVNESLEPLARAMNLGGWQFLVVYEAAEDGAGATCWPDPAYERARIRIDPDQYATESKLLQGLRHELLHVALAEGDQLVHSTTRVAIEGRLLGVFQEVHQYAVERQVLALERMLDRLGMTPERMLELAVLGEPESPE